MPTRPNIFIASQGYGLPELNFPNLNTKGCEAGKDQTEISVGDILNAGTKL